MDSLDVCRTSSSVPLFNTHPLCNALQLAFGKVTAQAHRQAGIISQAFAGDPSYQKLICALDSNLVFGIPNTKHEPSEKLRAPKLASCSTRLSHPMIVSLKVCS